MFNIFKNVIETSDFDLRDILNKIEESYIKSSLSKEEQEELEEMAAEFFWENFNGSYGYKIIEE